MRPAYSDDWATMYTGDAKEVLEALPERSVHAVVTSPPYWGLRSYLPTDAPDKHRELGAERTPEVYVEKLVEVFRAVWKVLRDDGTVWLNLGDPYNSGTQYNHHVSGLAGGARYSEGHGNKWGGHRPMLPALKPKDLIGIPWMVAFALRADGWYLRRDIVWSKDSCMPESVNDRPTSAHEYVFLLTKKPSYFYDKEAIAEPVAKGAAGSTFTNGKTGVNGLGRVSKKSREEHATRNARSVWRINPRPYPGSHYAVFPPELPTRCIRAGTSERGVCSECGAPWRRIVEKTGETTQEWAKRNGHAQHAEAYPGAKQNLDFKGSHWKLPRRESRTVGWEPTCQHRDAPTEPAVVLDPFSGSGTTAYVARKLARRSVLIDLDVRNVQLLEERLGYQGVLL